MDKKSIKTEIKSFDDLADACKFLQQAVWEVDYIFQWDNLQFSRKYRIEQDACKTSCGSEIYAFHDCFLVHDEHRERLGPIVVKLRKDQGRYNDTVYSLSDEFAENRLRNYCLVDSYLKKLAQEEYKQV